MRDKLIPVIIFSCILFSFPEVFALENYGDMMALRGGRGVRNVATAPLDLLNSMEDARFKDGLLSAMTYGVLKGVGISVARFCYGLYEVGTFYSTDLNHHQFEVNYDSALFRIHSGP